MSQEQIKFKNVSKIAILRANALGDFIVTLPAIKAIRQTYPRAEIVLLAKDWHKEYLVKGRSLVDRVISIPVIKNIRNEEGKQEDPEEVNYFFEAMAKERFDIALSFQGNGISAIPFLKKLRAGFTAGHACEESEKPDTWLPFYYYQNEVLRYLDVAALIGANTSEVEPEINVLESDRMEAAQLLPDLKTKQYVVLHPFATDIRRTWPLENFLDLAKIISLKGYEVVFSGSAAEYDSIQEGLSLLDIPVINTSGKLSLGALTALLSDAALLIASDTGPLHIARAVKTPTVGIYWAPNLVNWGPLTRALHRPAVSWELACPLCGITPNDPYPFEPQQNCSHQVSFVRNVTVKQVLTEAEILLSDIPAAVVKDNPAGDDITTGTNLLKMIA